MPEPATRSGVLARWLPGVAQLQGYPRSALRGDAVAALSVCMVMIPSVLAYAELVGLRPAAGLYAALAAMVAYALLAPGRRVIVGPDTTIALLAGSIIAPLALGDPARTAALAAMLAIACGALLLLAGRLHLGDIADLLSTPVLVGYANGAALVLIGTQLPMLLGVKLPRDAFFLRVVDALSALPGAHVPTLALGLVLVAVMVTLPRVLPRLPAALAACVLAVVASLALDLPARGVAHLAPVGTGLPPPSLPAFTLHDVSTLAPGALALALLVFAEGVLLARTLGAQHRESVDADRELVALGAGNVAAGLVAGFPVGASTSRSVTADAAGSQTQLTQFLAAALLLAFVLFLTPVLDVLPRVALAAILIAAGVRLFDGAGLRSLWRLDRGAYGLAWAVTLGVLALGVLPGVLLGVALSLARVLIEVARPRDALLRRLPTDRRFHDLADDEGGLATPGVLVYRLYAPLIFANARYVAERLQRLAAEANPPLRCVVLDLQAVPQIDVTALATIRDLHDTFEGGGIDVRFARANRPLREQLTRWLPDHRMGRERFFPSASAAVDDFVVTDARGVRGDGG
ncbi:MAG: SulP family inorganic anion transporter [Burkholderiales bacterium]